LTLGVNSLICANVPLRNYSVSHPPYLLPYLTVLPSFPFSLVVTALGVLRMLPVLQRLGDAHGFYTDLATPHMQTVVMGMFEHFQRPIHRWRQQYQATGS